MPDSQPDYRQDAPPMPGLLPSCPLCGAANQTGDETDPPVSRQPRGGTLAETFPYVCGRCWTVFAGTDEEWRRMREQREAYCSALDRVRAPSGEA